MDSRLIRPLPKPLLLKDYLLDDMNSCSSNGFKSFPRRQCCTTVRFLQEFDSKKKHHHQQQQKVYLNFNKPPRKSALSALQSVITAVKRLPFSAAKSPEKKKSNNSFLPRSFSKKILKRSNFWKRNKPEKKEIVGWKSFDQLLKEDPEPSDRSNSSITTRGSKSNSRSGSDFTVSTDGCSNGNSSSEVNLNLPEEGNDAVKLPMEVVVSDNGVVVTNGDVSTDSTTCSDGSDGTNSKKQWSSEEKEQFSPVSVLDCPFDDEDEVSSPFQHRLARMEGTKKKLLKKIQMFECLANLEPVNLATRFGLQQDSDDESSDSPRPHSSASIDEKFVSDIEEEKEEEHEEEEEEEKVLELLHQTKANMPSYALKLKADKLLLDFFRERITSESSFDEGLIEEAQDWINGRKPRDQLLMRWEVQKNRQAYVKDMEKGGEWKSLDQEIHEVALELENEVFAALLNELLLDILPEVTI